MGELGTERLRLERWTVSDGDIDFLFDLYSRWEVQRFIGRQPRVMVDRSEAVARAERLAEYDHPVHGLWAMTKRETGERLGVLLLKDLPASGVDLPLASSGKTEIGWHLHPNMWGRGYGTEAARRVLQHGFDSGLAQILAVTHPANVASQTLARRIGMYDLGLTDQYYNVTLQLFGVDHDKTSD